MAHCRATRISSNPKPAAKLGALVQEKLEPVVPDAIDHGKKPFIRPFMVTLADDHYALDIGAARRLLGWEPRHRIRDGLPALVQSLKSDPAGWFKAHGLEPPAWLSQAREEGDSPEAVRQRHEQVYRELHARHAWTH